MQVEMQDAEVYYLPNHLPAALASEYFDNLRNTLAWQQPSITLYGKTHKIPRLQAWYGDADAHYAYSNMPMQPMPWTKSLLELKHICETQIKQEFNSVLVNYYRHGQDSMGMHADDEPELGEQPIIASLSLGGARNFDFKHKQSAEKVRIRLQHGSLLVMQGDTQHYWQHGINKSKRDMQARINLTFRKVYNQSPQ